MSLIMEAIKKAQQRRWRDNQENSWPRGVLNPGISFGKKRGRWGVLLVLFSGGLFSALIFGATNYSLFSSSLFTPADIIKKEAPVPLRSQAEEIHLAEKNSVPGVREENLPWPPSAKPPKAEAERPLLPLTLVAITEPARPQEVLAEKEFFPQKAEEKSEVKDGRAKMSTIIAKKGEEDQKIEKVMPERQEKPLSPSTPEVPAPEIPEIKVEKLSGEIKSSPEAVKNFNAGVNFYQQRNLLQAMHAYKKALQYDPQFGEAYNNLALIYQEIGDLDQARETLQRATEINPHYEKAWNNLGIILLLQNRYGEAKEVFKKVLLLNPQHVESYLHLGVLYRKEGEIRKAAEYYQKALQINPLRGEVHYNLAIILEELNDIPQAISHYRSFLHLAAKDYPGLAAEVTRHINRLGKEQKGR